MGCDSIVSTVLSVLTSLCTNTTANICDGDSILLGGSYQTMAGTYVDSLTASAGCDSIVTTVLTVVTPVVTNATATICDGESIMLGGAMQTTAGVYNDTLSSALGCDSIVSTTLTVNPVVTTNATASICDGDSILLGGAMQTAAGVYNDTLSSALGCDSIISTTLTVLMPVTENATASVCDGDSVFLGGGWQSTAGTYTDTYLGSNGCDSIVSTALTIDPLPTVTVSTTDTMLCANFGQEATLTAAQVGIGVGSCC